MVVLLCFRGNLRLGDRDPTGPCILYTGHCKVLKDDNSVNRACRHFQDIVICYFNFGHI